MDFQFTPVIVIHFTNGGGLIVRVGLYEELFLMCTSVSTLVQDISATNLKSVIKNQDIKRHFFQNLDNFHI